MFFSRRARVEIFTAIRGLPRAAAGRFLARLVTAGRALLRLVLWSPSLADANGVSASLALLRRYYLAHGLD